MSFDDFDMPQNISRNVDLIVKDETSNMLKASSSVKHCWFRQTGAPVNAMMISRCSSTDTKPRKPRAVIFDMGGVVIPSPFPMFLEFEKQNGMKQGSLSKIIVQGGAEGPWSQLESGKISLSQFKEHFSKSLSEQVGKRIDVSPLLTSMGVNSREPFPIMWEAIKSVKAGGFKTALLTNNWFLDEKKTKTLLPIDGSLFDVVVQSCVIGVRKPDTGIYARALQELNVQPEESVFLDDLGHNLKTAKDMGMKTIKVNSPEQAVRDLQQVLGIPLGVSDVAGTTEVQKHLELDMAQLEHYLKSLGLEDDNPPEIRVFEHGQSNPTYYLSYGGRKMVLRKKPPGKLLPSAHAVDREYRIMVAMKKGCVPVPNMIAFCEDSSVVGTPFYLMDYLDGSIYKEFAMKGVDHSLKRQIAYAMIDVLVKIHSLDIDKVGLSDYGKKGQFMERNFKRWASQYAASKTSEIESMNKLIAWLPKHFPKDEKVTVVHGDFRLDNLMFRANSSEVIAILDWELSTLGDPLSDLATCLLVYYIPSSFTAFPGLLDADIKELGLPTVEELVARYCQQSGVSSIPNFNFYMAYVCFRMTAIIQGVYKRAISGQSSSSQGEIIGKFAEFMADIGCSFAGVGSKSASVNPSSTSGGSGSGSPMDQKRMYSTLTSSHRVPVLSTLARPMSSGSSSIGVAGQMAVSVEGLSPRVQELHAKVKAFIQEVVVPLENLKKQRLQEPGFDRWSIMPELEEAKRKSKAAGLWNLFVAIESDPGVKYGAGLTNLEYAFLCEEMGKYGLGAEVFNCSAPDTGNMETILRYGTVDQKEKWLQPLLEGKIRSCFAMTEPAVASSDATNIQATIQRDGDNYIINGHKWWTSGALDPRCKICVFMGKTNPGASRHLQQSMVLVPMDTPGVKVIRSLTVFGFDDAPEGHGEVIFENVKVPMSNILLGEGRGFEIAQGRLGPGRIHHCMRLIGCAERALGLMIDRTMNRVAFGKPLAAQGTIQQDVAKSRLDIEQCRLLVLKAAYVMDLHGNKVAAPEIAMIKIAAPNMALRVIDRSMQAHGGAGVHSDLPLAYMYAGARSLRFADGPDEVHLRAVSRMEYAKVVKAKL